MNDELRPPLHTVPPPPPAKPPACPPEVRPIRPPRQVGEVEKLLHSIVANIRLLRGEIARVQAEQQELRALVGGGFAVMEDYMRRHGEQLDAQTKALRYLVDRKSLAQHLQDE